LSFLSTLSAEALYPLPANGNSSLETVSQDHKKLFGTEPRHPQTGEYSWDGYELSSNQYGTQSNKTRPPYEEGDRDFGLFSHFEHVRRSQSEGGTFSVEMQFEQDGLRTRMTWKLSTD
jgi:hypothetical protein